MKVIITETDAIRGNLLPLTYLRPCARIRVGIDSIASKWQRMLGGDAEIRFETSAYLRPKYPPYPAEIADAPDTLRVTGNIIPTPAMAAAVLALRPGQALVSGSGDSQRLIAQRGPQVTEQDEYPAEVLAIDRAYDIFLLNSRCIRADFEAFTTLPGRKPSETVTVIGDLSQLYIHPDADDIEGCTINVKEGPVYIGPRSQVMEGACLRGPIAIEHNSVVRMGAKVYGGTTIGPWCKIGGEVDNAVFFGYSNKAHDGYLGNAVIAEWCNLGAGCTASNLKNDYTEIKLWNYPAHRFVRTGLQFCGLIMGDHSKAGVNTMLNTATTLGVGVNVHGSGFPRPFLASFSEGSVAGFTDVPMARFFDIARRVMARRGIELTDTDIDILNHVREYAEQFR